MKYPASEHYSHLDPSEPIPEIEPRVNEYMLVGYKAFSKLAVWIILGMIALQMLLYALVPSYLTARMLGFATAMLMLFLVFGFMTRAQRRTGLKRKAMKNDPWGVPVRIQIHYYIAFMFFMWAMQDGMNFRDGLLSGMLLLGIYAAFLGMGLIFVARFARQPGQISCERCFYPLAGLTLPTECPECGRFITSLKLATDRPRVRDGRLLAAGIALVVLAGSFSVLRVVSPQSLYAPMPRGALLPLAAIDRDAFAQLTKSPLTTQEEQQLLRSMVNARTGFTSGSSYAQGAWFSAWIIQGALSAEELDRLFMPATQCRIKAPSSALVGEPVRLLIEADYRPSPSGTAVAYYFEGYRIGDDPTPHASADSARYRTFLYRADDPDHIRKGYVPKHDWTPTEPGSYTVRTRLVFVLAPGTGTQDRIDWSADGDARFPKPPLWAHEVELEHTISIVE